MCAHVGTGVYEYMWKPEGQLLYMCVCVCVCGGVPQEQLSLTGTWNLLIRPGWLFSEPQGHTCFRFLNTRIAVVIYAQWYII